MNELRGAIGILWLAFWIYWLISAFNSKKNDMSSAGYAPGIRIVIFIFALILIRSGFGDNDFFGRHSLAVTNRVVIVFGFLVFLSGLAIAIWARLNLGRNWGMPMTRKKDAELITSGPYRFIRHPIYTGVLLGLIGNVFAISFYWLGAVLLVGTYFVYSAITEEKIMSSKFPKTYDSYKKRTKMLIPFVL